MISVIIPVYNGERFIEKAIRSALQQPEVSEILVINDGSIDSTATILERLQHENPRVKLYQHYNGINKGRSASRNLGLAHAKGEFIAFLDADDYYLENRFTSDIKLFHENESFDGIYNAIGVHFYRDATVNENNELAIYTVSEKINSKELFNFLLKGGKGNFSIDGLTLRKNFIRTVGFFNEKLEVAEDTDLIWRLALALKLEAGIITRPVAIRGVHDANVFNIAEKYKVNYILMLKSVLIWASKNKIERKQLDLLLNRIWILKQKENNSLLNNINYWNQIFLPNKELLFSRLSLKYFPIVRFRQDLFPFYK